MNLHFMYFTRIMSWANLKDYVTYMGRDITQLYPSEEEVYNRNYLSFVNNTKDYFLSKIDAESYYLFIISRKQLPDWNKHLDRFGMREFIHYQKMDIPNKMYSDDKRLNVFIMKFNKEFVEKWKK